MTGSNGRGEVARTATKKRGRLRASPSSWPQGVTHPQVCALQVMDYASCRDQTPAHSLACRGGGAVVVLMERHLRQQGNKICSPGCMSRLRFSISPRVRQRAPHMPHMPTVGAFTYAHASHGIPNSMRAGAAEVGATTGLGRLLSFSRARRALCCRCCLDRGGGCQHGNNVAQRTPICSEKHLYKACAR